MNLLNDYINNSSEKFAEKFLNKNIYGQINVIFPSGKEKTYGYNNTGYEANLKLNNPNFFYKLIKKGSVGLAESYMDGDFESKDLSKLLLFAYQNQKNYLKKKQAKWYFNFLIKLRHYLNQNTIHNSKKNIKFHYDLGNDFYKYWLDETMTYSSALFEKNNSDLLNAQINKYKLIAEPLQLNEGSSLLEIGCGWGGFSTFVAKNYGAKVRAITISKKQYEFAKEKVFNEGLNERINIEMLDYRNVKEKYNSIASIEMFEAVGRKYWLQFFETVKNSLTKNGTAAMQIITIDESKVKDYQNNPDFIQQYIFPGGILPSKKQLNNISFKIGCRFEEYKSFNISYAKTLNLWNKKFQESWCKIADQGYSKRFKRMWEYYFSYCEAGFISGSTDVSQFLLKK